VSHRVKFFAGTQSKKLRRRKAAFFFFLKKISGELLQNFSYVYSFKELK